MRTVTFAAALLALTGAAFADRAQALELQLGEVSAELLLAASAQGAAFQAPRATRSDEDGEASYSARLDLEWLADNGWTFGLRAEVDNGGRRSEELARDEIYLYASSDIGRFELGEQDGAADVMAYHAPVTALAQIRGDFSRYAGSRASLSPIDTSDAAKLVYLSPPLRGLRFGASYAPTFESNEDDPDPRRRTIQDDAVELALQYQRPLAGEWTLGASATYVTASADRLTTRRDIDAWGGGLELRRDVLAIGAAYVDNGDSNDLVPSDEREWNAGIAWRTEKWGAALSFARIDSIAFDNRLIGAGGYYEIGKYVTVRADLVRMDERRAGLPDDDGYVFLLELGVQL
jgi:hypothetical protein